MARYGMAINVERCMGCHSCAVACKVNNNLPKDIWRNRIETDGGTYQDTSRGEYPNNLFKQWIPVTCQQCTKPICYEVCPQDATYVREDGIVDVYRELCIGCGTCVDACPYKARVVNPSEIEYYTEHALGDYDAPVHTNGVVNKCDMCTHRLGRDTMPACMEFCPGDARHWGDLDDPNSDVSKFIAGKQTSKYLETEGTEPNCFYIGLKAE